MCFVLEENLSNEGEGEAGGVGAGTELTLELLQKLWVVGFRPELLPAPSLNAAAQRQGEEETVRAVGPKMGCWDSTPEQVTAVHVGKATGLPHHFSEPSCPWMVLQAAPGLGFPLLGTCSSLLPGG